MAVFQSSVHDVTKIELIKTYLSNDNSHTIRITATTYRNVEVLQEQTFYGSGASALAALPKSSDFREVI